MPLTFFPAGMPSFQFEQAMEGEHCTSKDSTTTFTTGNYHITTFPLKEWKYVVKGEFDSDHMTHGRIVKDVSKLVEEHNKLIPAGGAMITRHEVISAVLYTGPMVRKEGGSGRETRGGRQIVREGIRERVTQLIATAPVQFQVYNSILRQFPKEAYDKQCAVGNMYTTTIYVLVSAVGCIARATRLPTGLKLYRGLGGDRTFPPHFHKRDDKGRKGVVEWGFMSTTADKKMALKFSGIMEGKPFSTILEIDSGTVDRGADLTSFSQYPGIRH
jgi:hypothetical protein